MKRILCLVLSVLMLAGSLSVFAACGDAKQPGTETESKTATESVTESATESVTETETEEETEPEMPDGAVLYVGPMEDKPTAYYFSIEEAIEDNPDGCLMFMVDDYEMTGTIPAGYNCRIYYLMYDVTLNIEEGAYVDYAFATRLTARFYISNPHDLELPSENRLPYNDPNGMTVWVIADPEGTLDPAGYKYLNKNANDLMLEAEYEFTYFYDLSRINDRYISEADGIYYLSAQEGIDYIKVTNKEMPNLCGHSMPDEQVTPPVPGTEYMQYPYWWFVLLSTFPYGITWDDVDWAADGAGHWFCYFNDITKFASGSSTWRKYAYIWSDAEGFRPGLYSMPLIVDPTEEVRYDEDGLIVETDLGFYHYTWIADMLYLDVADELSDYAHLEIVEEWDGETCYLIIDEQFYDLRPGRWAIVDNDVENYGNRQFDGEGNLIATDFIIYRFEYLGEE